MKTIIDLPQEILESVSILLLPHSLGAFVLACKAIYLQSRSVIDRHKANIAKWRNIKSSGPYRHDVLHILYDIVREPLMVEYVERIDLWDRREYWEIRGARERSGLKWDIRKDAKIMRSIQLMVESSPILQEATSDIGRWWGFIELENLQLEGKYQTGISPATVLTLLMFLPRLKVLGLPSWWDSDRLPLSVLADDCLRETLQYLVTTASKPLGFSEHSLGITPSDRPLARLETIIPFKPYGRDEWVDGHTLNYFFALPNLQEVCLTSVIFLDYAEPRMVLHSTQLRRLELAYSACSPDAVASILQPLRRLEVFKYSYETKAQPDILDTGEFLDSVASAAGRTLCELVLRVDNHYENFRNPPNSFQEFIKLKELDVDMNWILQQSMDGVDPDYCHLATALPSTIRKVLLNAESDILEGPLFQSIFAGLKTEWETRLVDLESVVVRVQELEEEEEEEDDDEENEADIEEDSEEDHEESDKEEMDLRSRMNACQKAVEKQHIKWKVLSASRFQSMGWKKEFDKRFNCAPDLFADPA